MGLGHTPIFFSVGKKTCPPYTSTQIHRKYFAENRDQYSEGQIIVIIDIKLSSLSGGMMRNQGEFCTLIEKKSKTTG